jgi:hypothetical protein
VRLGGPAETQCLAGLLVEKHTTPNTPVWLNSEVTSALKTKRRLGEKSKVRPDAEIQRSRKIGSKCSEDCEKNFGCEKKRAKEKTKKW